MIAEETAELMNYHDFEGGGLGRSRFDQALELRPLIVRLRRTWLETAFDEVVSARLAISLALALLIGNGNVMLRLPRRGDTW